MHNSPDIFSHGMKYLSSIYRWIAFYISQLFNIVLLPLLPFIQLPSIGCCQPWAGKLKMALPFSTFYGSLQRRNIRLFCIHIVFSFLFCCQHWWMAKLASVLLSLVYLFACEPFKLNLSTLKQWYSHLKFYLFVHTSNNHDCCFRVVL